jgi:hypothetical protein
MLVFGAKPAPRRASRRRSPWPSKLGVWRTPMNLPPDLIELFSAFGAGGVRYLLVGGHAVAAHGRPRTTKDVDIWLEPHRENIERACGALARFGVPAEIVEALRTAKVSEIVWLGRPPVRIDFLQALPGVDFRESWSRRVTVDIGGVSITVIAKDDLMANKRAVGRPQDIRDVRALSRQTPVMPRRKRRTKSDR